MGVHAGRTGANAQRGVWEHCLGQSGLPAGARLHLPPPPLPRTRLSAQGVSLEAKLSVPGVANNCW